MKCGKQHSNSQQILENQLSGKMGKFCFRACVYFHGVPTSTMTTLNYQCNNTEHEAGKRCVLSQAWWPTSVISALWRLRQEDHKFKTKLGYIVSSRPACTT
jgi:hypothetical protein